MDICNKQKIDAPRVCTFPFLSSGPCLTKSELGKIRDLESGNLFLGGSREVSRRRWRDDKLETGSTLWAFCSTALGNTALKYPLHSRRKPTLSWPWADDSSCSEKSCFLSWDTAKWNLPCDLWLPIVQDRQSAAFWRAHRACTEKACDSFAQRTDGCLSPSR